MEAGVRSCLRSPSPMWSSHDKRVDSARSPSPAAPCFRQSAPAGMDSHRISRKTADQTDEEMRVKSPRQGGSQSMPEPIGGAGLSNAYFDTRRDKRGVAWTPRLSYPQDKTAGAQSMQMDRPRRSTEHIDYNREYPARSPSPFDVRVAAAQRATRATSYSPDAPRRPQQVSSAAFEVGQAFTPRAARTRYVEFSESGPSVEIRGATTPSLSVPARSESKPRFELDFGALRDRESTPSREGNKDAVWRPSGGPESLRKMATVARVEAEEWSRTPRTPRSPTSSVMGTPRSCRSLRDPPQITPRRNRSITPRRNRSTSRLPGDVLSATRSFSKSRSVLTLEPIPLTEPAMTPRRAHASSQPVLRSTAVDEQQSMASSNLDRTSPAPSAMHTPQSIGVDRALDDSMETPVSLREQKVGMLTSVICNTSTSEAARERPVGNTTVGHLIRRQNSATREVDVGAGLRDKAVMIGLASTEQLVVRGVDNSCGARNPSAKSVSDALAAVQSEWIALPPPVGLQARSVAVPVAVDVKPVVRELGQAGHLISNMASVRQSSPRLLESVRLMPVEKQHYAGDAKPLTPRSPRNPAELAFANTATLKQNTYWTSSGGYKVRGAIFVPKGYTSVEGVTPAMGAAFADRRI